MVCIYLISLLRLCLTRNMARRLYAAEYPQDRSLFLHLVNLYFDRISTLRCLGFVHKPSFVKAIDRGLLADEYGEPLIYIISALGARCEICNSPSAPFREPC